jgi:hypothetical protein
MGQTAVRQKQKALVKAAGRNKEKNAASARQADSQRKYLNVQAAPEEIESLILVNAKSEAAEEAARLQNFPADAAKEQILIFIEAALNARAEAMLLRRRWWQEIKTKYPQLPIDTQNVFVDFDTGKFYVFARPEE